MASTPHVSCREDVEFCVQGAEKQTDFYKDFTLDCLGYDSTYQNRQIHSISSSLVGASCGVWVVFGIGAAMAGGMRKGCYYHEFLFWVKTCSIS